MQAGAYDLKFYRDDQCDVAATLKGFCARETKTLTDDARGYLLAFLRRMAAGQLVHEDDDKDLVPCASQPDIWELYPFGDDVLVRAYHGEPTRYAGVLVITHSHEKWVGGTSDEIKNAQNAEMAIAQQRFDDGMDSMWGNDPVQAARRDIQRARS